MTTTTSPGQPALPVRICFPVASDGSGRERSPAAAAVVVEALRSSRSIFDRLGGRAFRALEEAVAATTEAPAPPDPHEATREGASVRFWLAPGDADAATIAEALMSMQGLYAAEGGEGQLRFVGEFAHAVFVHERPPRPSA